MIRKAHIVEKKEKGVGKGNTGNTGDQDIGEGKLKTNIDSKTMKYTKFYDAKLNPYRQKKSIFKKQKQTQNKKLSRNKYLQEHKLLSHLPNNYISNLVNLYYDNDNVVKNFLEYKKTKQHIFPEHSRVIVIGDIHGDFEVAIRCLILSKCIEPINIPMNKNVSTMDKFFKNLEWIGDNTYIVQLGDQIDRVRPQVWDNNEVTRNSAYKDEGSTLEIFYLFYHLDNLARKNKGRVFSIIGNHEIMNIEGDFRYVSLEEFSSFKNHLESVYHRNSKYPYHSRTLKKK